MIPQGGFFDALGTAISKSAADFTQALITFPQLGAIFLLTFCLFIMFGPDNRK